MTHKSPLQVKHSFYFRITFILERTTIFNILIRSRRREDEMKLYYKAFFLTKDNFILGLFLPIQKTTDRMNIWRNHWI